MQLSQQPEQWLRGKGAWGRGQGAETVGKWSQRSKHPSRHQDLQVKQRCLRLSRCLSLSVCLPVCVCLHCLPLVKLPLAGRLLNRPLTHCTPMCSLPLFLTASHFIHEYVWFALLFALVFLSSSFFVQNSHTCVCCGKGCATESPPGHSLPLSFSTLPCLLLAGGLKFKCNS